MLVASLRIVSTYRVFNHTIDEPQHLAAGMEWLSRGKYWYEDQHPPISRIAGALGPYLAGERWKYLPNSYEEGYGILGHGEHYFRMLFLGRLTMLPFFWVACFVVYQWAMKTGGRKAALWSLLVFTTVPVVLGHAGLITTDMALTAFVGAAAFASLEWAEQPTRKRAVWFGVALALAACSKFSSLLFLPGAWLVMYACHWSRTHPDTGTIIHQVTTRSRSALLVLGVAFLATWAVYRFSFARVEFLHIRLPAPRFFTGLESVWRHNHNGHLAYLFGQRSGKGFWYYYPVDFLVKTPIAMLLLTAGSILLAIRKRAGEVVMPLAFSLAILLFAMPSRINIGIRHILPVYVGFSIACGWMISRVFHEHSSKWGIAKAGVAVLFTWQIVAGAVHHPDYFAYVNECFSREPERFVADSDLDWGQDMARLAARLHQAGAKEVTFRPFNYTYPRLAGEAFPQMLVGAYDRPSPGWNAVSISMWKIFGVPAWAARYPIQERVGQSILLWHFTPEQMALEPGGLPAVQ